jgi:hypothetical protein
LFGTQKRARLGELGEDSFLPLPSTIRKSPIGHQQESAIVIRDMASGKERVFWMTSDNSYTVCLSLTGNLAVVFDFRKPRQDEFES